ncbi:MAG: nucleoside transporter [candidate division Zixibacteria bacterium]|nr:nucleoside transporter [Candidatus Tariuqbacter arcticus]
MTILNLISFLGMAILVFTAWLLSSNRKIFNWRVVLWGIGLQMAFAGFIFIVPAGAKVFIFLNDIILAIIDAASEGAKFCFGVLALPPGTEGSLGFNLAFQAFPTIVFFAALVALLYYLRVMPFLIELFARIFTRWMKLSGAESLCVSSNIFVGVESALTVKPYLEKMTRSELCTIMAAMMGTIASSVLAFYVMILQGTFSHIAGHLVSASILSAPAAVVMSKLILPETGEPVTLGRTVKAYYERESSAVESIINGAMAGGRMVFGIVVMLLAFLGLVALLNKITVFAGGGVNSVLGINIDFTLQGMLGYLFYPFTVIMGVHPQDAYEIARIIGERTVVTEVNSYQDLAALISNGGLVDKRSAILATYALCGFAHFASLGIFIGGIAAIAPGKIKDLAGVGFRALIAATLGCQMTGCVAGVFLTKGSILLG